MSGTHVRVVVTLFGASLPLVVAACARNDESTQAGSADDAGGEPSVREAAANHPDASADASADAGDVDAAPKTCSDEGWCHTVLPKPVTLRDVWGDGKGTVWSVSEQGHILRWDGAAWTIVFTATMPLHAIWGSSSTDLWVGGANGLLHGQGATANTLTWTPIALEVPIFSVAGTSANDVWATGYVAPTYNAFNGGRIFHYEGPSDDASTGWVVDPVSFDHPARYEKAWASSGKDVWIAGASSFSSGSAVHRVSDADGGVVWSRATPPSGSTFGRGGSIGKDKVVLLGSSPPETYYLGQSADDGATFDWTWRDGFGMRKMGYALNAVWGSGLGDIYVAGNFGRFWQFDGTAWRVPQIATQNVLPVTANLNAIWGSGPGDIWVVGQNIALHKGH